jgi:hypothetical protein
VTERHRERDRETERGRDIERETERQRDRERERQVKRSRESRSQSFLPEFAFVRVLEDVREHLCHRIETDFLSLSLVFCILF